MAVEVKVGLVIPKESLKSGDTKDGRRWVFGSVKAEQGYDKIDVWAENAKDVSIHSDAEIVEIIAVKKSARRYQAQDGTEKWADVYSVNAKMKNKEAVPSGFEKLTEEDIPF